MGYLPENPGIVSLSYPRDDAEQYRGTVLLSYDDQRLNLPPLSRTYPALEVVQRVVAQLPWGHNMALLGHRDTGRHRETPGDTGDGSAV